ncbi:MAG TPA: HAD family hydrolase, partial [Bacillota bacterium]|nr:HAD family hydrolase [Bacillota bacterium]
LLGNAFADIAPPEVFAGHVMESSVATMRDPSDDLTNKQKFMKRFIPRVGRSEEELLPRFDRFYREQFPVLARYAKPSPLARSLAESALTKGYGIVMATNPVFPREAVLERMRWAGILDLPWAHITSYEDTRYCKPNPKYFTEILETLGAVASRCLHIGNDMDEDFSASRVGLPVVMVSDFLINRDNKPLTDCLYYGTLSEVTAWFDSSR